jgi:hypothetical protein
MVGLLITQPFCGLSIGLGESAERYQQGLVDNDLFLCPLVIPHCYCLSVTLGLVPGAGGKRKGGDEGADKAVSHMSSDDDGAWCSNVSREGKHGDSCPWPRHIGACVGSPRDWAYFPRR